MPEIQAFCLGNCCKPPALIFRVDIREDFYLHIGPVFRKQSSFLIY